MRGRRPSFLSFFLFCSSKPHAQKWSVLTINIGHPVAVPAAPHFFFLFFFLVFIVVLRCEEPRRCFSWRLRDARKNTHFILFLFFLKHNSQILCAPKVPLWTRLCVDRKECVCVCVFRAVGGRLELAVPCGTHCWLPPWHLPLLPVVPSSCGGHSAPSPRIARAFGRRCTEV